MGGNAESDGASYDRADKVLREIARRFDMKHISRLVRVFVLIGVTMTFSALPVHADTFYRYPGISCGPDQVAYIWTVSSGPGTIDGIYATWQNGGWVAGTFWYATGSNTTYMPSRYLNSYDAYERNGATLQAHGAGCA